MSGGTTGVVAERDVPCVARDGTTLIADIYHPADSRRYPTLISRTPYDRTIPRSADIAAELAAAGYVVVVQDTRGRFGSTGSYQWMFGPWGATTEASDGYDTVEWASNLEWSNGSVGAYGHSYDAWNVWMMLATSPPSLEAAFTSGMTPNLRSFTSGIFETGRRLEWTYVMAATDPGQSGLSQALSRDEAERRWREVERGKYVWWLPLAEIPSAVFSPLDDMFRKYLQTPHQEVWDLNSTYPLVDVPVMQLTGWWDRLVGTVDNHRGLTESGRSDLRGEHRIIVGPWGHDTTNLTGQVGPIDYGAEATRDYSDVLRRWFDYRLKGIDDGIGAEAPVQVFVLGANEWRGLPTWPPPDMAEMKLYLQSAGSANTIDGDGSLAFTAPDPVQGDRADDFVYDPRDPLMSLMRADSQTVPVDQSPHDFRPDVLVYETGDLESDLTIVGRPRLTLWAATDGRDTDWTAKLAIVRRDGVAVNLSHGIVRARFRNGGDEEALLTPGEAYEYRLELTPTAIRIHQGQRLRLYISSSDFPNFDRNHNTGAPAWNDPELRPAHQTVFHSHIRPSNLTVPVSTTATSP